jgi:hypothetical protein
VRQDRDAAELGFALDGRPFLSTKQRLRILHHVPRAVGPLTHVLKPIFTHVPVSESDSRHAVADLAPLGGTWV